MLRARVAALLVCAVSSGLVACRHYNPNVSTWVEVHVPPKSDSADHRIWFYAADYSNLEWMVARRGNYVHAHLFGWREMLKWAVARPPFVPRAEQFSGGRAFRVNDGWLVSFNEGEFGAALLLVRP